MNRKESTYFSRLLFFNIALILLLGVLPQVGIFQYMIQAYNTELYRFNTQSARQIQNTVDQQLLLPTVQIAKRNLTELSDDNTALFYPMTHDIRHDYSAIAAVKEALTALQSEQPFIRYVDMYYFRDPVFFYGTRYFYFPGESERDPGFRAAWLDDFLTTDIQVGWYAASAPDAYGTNERLISYVRSYPYFAPADRRKAVFAIHLKESAVRQALADNFDPGYGLSLIVDEQGRLISHNGAGEDEAVYNEAASIWANRESSSDETGQGSFESELDGRSAVVAYAHSRVNNWDYITVVDKNVFYKKAAELKNLMYGVWAALLVVGVALLYMLTKRQYRPIDTTLRRYSTQIHDLNEQFAINKPVIKYHYMMDLLSGAGSGVRADAGEDEMPAMLDFELRRGTVCAFIMRLAEVPGEEPPLTASYQFAERLESEPLEDGRLWAVVAPDRRIYGLLNVSGGEARAQQLLTGLASRLTGPADRLFIGSARISGREGIAASHREAQEASQYAFFYPGRASLRYAELDTDSRLSTGGSARSFDELESALRSGDEKRALQAIGATVDETLAGHYTAEYGMHQLNELVYTLHKTLKTLGVDTQQLFGADIREQVRRLPDIGVFRGWIDDLARTALLHLRERRQSTNRELVDGARAFIDDNLYNEISLDRAAEHLGVTSNYVSRQFRLNTGMTFIEYVTTKKLEAAAELLRAGELNVSAIAEKLGYQSTNHFIRIFKEKYGLTPKQYQKSGQTGAEQDIS
ncbi:AraC family transcriptional regulator [Saccharibacillus sp. CPCC 101409]|uniref:AraC family transcriptional regulator n=1 Tax=Saccharibacillus sp. CPCC 101409 TaxID=3058041 RepID=UPI002672D62E|nr:AraC family transcriptional regulator [Saccharibacillus sp. CPCC 101409]MDO3412488.1 AraC family transcriptional regulator [Saccharibacillus sp. CPCC 101409]